MVPARSLPVFVGLHFVEAKVTASYSDLPRLSAPADGPPFRASAALRNGWRQWVNVVEAFVQGGKPQVNEQAYALLRATLLEHCRPAADGNGGPRPVILEENVWVGGQVFIAPGVRVGRNSVVGMHAAVFEDVPPDVIVAGNPARIVRRFEAGPDSASAKRG